MTEHPIIEARPWAERSNTLCVIPGKKGERREAIAQIVAQLPAKPGDKLQVRRAQGPDVEVTADSLCVNQLSRGSLVRRENNLWCAAEPLISWLENPDDDHLAEHLHANTKFFGELLERVEHLHSKAEFLAFAREYGLRWTSTTPLYARINWLELLGLVERWETYKFVITPRGHAYLRRIEIVPQEHIQGSLHSAESESVPILPKPDENLAVMLADLGEDHNKRKVLIGYVPRGRKAPDRDSDAGSQSPLEAIRNMLDLMGDRSPVEKFYKACISQLGMKRASASQTLQTMRQMNVFESVALNEYGPVASTVELAQPGNELDFARYLHCRYRFVGELLTVIGEPTPVPEIVKTANDIYGLEQIDNADVRTRLGFMLEADLVERIDWTRYRATPLGRALSESLPLEQPAGQVLHDAEEEVAVAPQATTELDLIVSDMQSFSRRSDASRDFELAVARAFRVLGFHAQHLGGSGRTDVVINAFLPGKDGYRAIVDAKSSASGMITDNHVKFDALKDHQRAQRADFGLIVGPDFTERVRTWAISNSFTLLTVDDLSNLLRKHVRNPLSLPELKLLFERTGDDLADIEEQYSSADRSSSLLAKLIELLYIEAREEDPLMDGYISLEIINHALRKEMSPRPPSEIVEECLQLLSHDLVRGAIQAGSRYKLADAPINIKRRLNGLVSGLAAIGAEDR